MLVLNRRQIPWNFQHRTLSVQGPAHGHRVAPSEAAATAHEKDDFGWLGTCLELVGICWALDIFLYLVIFIYFVFSVISVYELFIIWSSMYRWTWWKMWPNCGRKNVRGNSWLFQIPFQICNSIHFKVDHKKLWTNCLESFIGANCGRNATQVGITHQQARELQGCIDVSLKGVIGPWALGEVAWISSGLGSKKNKKKDQPKKMYCRKVDKQFALFFQCILFLGSHMIPWF